MAEITRTKYFNYCAATDSLFKVDRRALIDDITNFEDSIPESYHITQFLTSTKIPVVIYTTSLLTPDTLSKLHSKIESMLCKRRPF